MSTTTATATTTTTTTTTTTKSKSYFKFHAFNNAVAGLSAGFTTTALLHPLDLIKTRMQVQDSLLSLSKSLSNSHSQTITTHHNRYRNTFHAASSIVKENGVKGLYEGVAPNLIGNVTAWGSYFFMYGYLKTFYSENLNINGTPQHVLSAATAGVVTLSITNPVWVIKTRMCTQSFNPLEKTAPNL